jgi:hypothetical protein
LVLGWDWEEELEKDIVVEYDDQEIWASMYDEST